MADLPLHSNSHPSFYRDNSTFLQPAASDSPPDLCLLESQCSNLFGSSKRIADDHDQARRSTKQLPPPLGKRRPWLLSCSCRRLEMADQHEENFIEFEDDDTRSLSFRRFINGEEERSRDEKNHHSLKLFQYILDDHGEKELTFDVHTTSNGNGSQSLDIKCGQVAGNPNSSLQITRKKIPTSNLESRSALKLPQIRVLPRGRSSRMLTATGIKKNLIEMFSPEKFKRRLLGLAMKKMNAKSKTKQALALKNETTDRVNDNGEEEFWKKKILMGRRCRPLKMDDEGGGGACQAESSRSAKVVPWMTLEEKVVDHDHTVDSARKLMSEDCKQNAEKRSSFRELMQMVDKLGI